ncbi:cobalt-precorrin-6Y C(5)-methyltransferase [Salmonella enterica subsp. arizonae]|uniref:Cobalt-precorrin-6Y C(5)-methyltransferase n=5 Tax=Salmonella enterica TaxID=28901 RepID=A0A2X4T6H2_SALER|nr:cobalt-precorrin-6Y C(5)-methyltransferase [Salmonella enterica subsp. arizonae]
MLTVVGMGPAGRHLMTPAALESDRPCRCAGSGKRHLAQFPTFAANDLRWARILARCCPGLPPVGINGLWCWPPAIRCFYGIGTHLVAHFGIEQVRIIPGISAVQYLCAQAGIDMNDMWLTSKPRSLRQLRSSWRNHRKVAMVTDARCGPREIARELVARGKGHRLMVIGENLAMENERIHWLPVSAVNADYEMNAVVILDER